MYNFHLSRKRKEENNMKIAVAGTGYVGLSMATLLSQHHCVTAVDVIEEMKDGAYEPIGEGNIM